MDKGRGTKAIYRLATAWPTGSTGFHSPPHVYGVFRRHALPASLVPPAVPYGAAECGRCGCFAINESPIARIHIVDLLKAHDVGDEPGVPYPQANDLDKVVDLVSLVDQGVDTKTEIADFFEFDERQGDYYANAGIYLGLLERHAGSFILTDLGGQFVQIRSTAGKSRFIIAQLLARPTFRSIFEVLLEKDLKLDALSNERIAAAIHQLTDLSGTTPRRRASTVRSWLKWILENSEIVL